MRLLITGASGNVGTALLERLQEPHSLGDVEVVATSRRRPPETAPYDRVSRWLELDLAEPGAADELTSLASGVDSIHHLAWGFQPSHDIRYLDAVAQDGTRAVLEAAARTGVKQIVHMSSVGAYAPHPGDRDGYPERVDETWPATGMPQLAYSLEKAAVERLLDVFEVEHPDVRVARLRPGVIAQGQALSGLARYMLPAFLPLPVLRHLPVLPLDRRLAVQLVHARDVADAHVKVLERRAWGAYNLAAEPVVTAELIASSAGKRLVHVPRAALKGLATAMWKVRAQPVDPGWVDLAMYSPLMDMKKAREELGWEPQYSSAEVLEELYRASREPASAPSGPLRRRTVPGEVKKLLQKGPVSERRLP